MRKELTFSPPRISHQGAAWRTAVHPRFPAPALFRRPSLSVALLATLLAVLIGRPAAAQQPAGGIAWSAEPLFGGTVKYGEWLPIRITLSNQGRDRAVEVRATATSADGQATFVEPVELPRDAHKQTTLYVAPSSFLRRLRLTLVDGAEELDNLAVEVRPISYGVLLVGIIARNPDALFPLGTLAIHNWSVQTVAFDIDEVPERAAGLRSFDALILNDVDTTRLSPAQQQALAAWVQLGGHLVIGGGAGAALTMAGVPAELLPVAVHDTRAVSSLPGLAAIVAEPVRIGGPFVLASTTPQRGVVLAGQEDTPLIVEQAVGQGRVTFVALDLGSSPFGEWAGEKLLWTALLEAESVPFLGGPPDMSPRRWADGQMMNALANLPALDLPSVRWIALLLAAYILLVGPANYLLLRRARRLEWAWLTIPAMTLTFSVGAYGVGYGMRGGDVILHQLSIIELSSGSQIAEIRTYAGLFSPTRRSYNLVVEGDPLVSPVNPTYSPWSGSAGGGNLTVVQGQAARVRDLAVNQWAMQTFVAEFTSAPPVDVRPELSYRDGRIYAEVTNQGAWPLRDAVVVMGGSFGRLGTIAAGQTATTSFAVSATGDAAGMPLSYLLLQDEFEKPGPRGLSRDTRLKQQMLDGVFAPLYEGGQTVAEPLVIAWLDEAPTPIRPEGASASTLATSVVIVRPTLDLGDRQVSVPPGFIPAQLVADNSGVGACYSSRGLGVAPYQGQATLDFRLPHELHDVEFTRLSLLMESDGGWWQPPAMSLYDWQAGTWQPLEGVALGINPIDDAGRFVDPATHTIRVQMQAGESQGGCLYANIALEGTRSKQEVGR